MATNKLFVPDDVSTPYSRQDNNVRLLQYTNSSTTENFDAFLTHHALIYILSGTKQIKVSQRAFNINPGELILIPRGEYVMSEYITGEQNFQSIMLFFNQKVARYVVDELKGRINSDYKEVFKKEAIKIIPKSRNINELYHSLITYSKENSPFIPDIISLKFMELIYLLLDTPYQNVIMSFLLDAARYETPSIASILEQNLYSPLTVEKLAKLAGRSLSNFKREFTKQYKVSPKKWIKTKKLERAAFLLDTSDKTIEDISDDCGFVNSTHFSRLFKKLYSVTPTEFRAKQTDN